jgi:hypothetical protein
MVIQHKARIQRRAQHHIAHRQHMIEMLGILGLEGQAGHRQHLHQRPVAQPQRMGIEMGGIGQTSPARASRGPHAAGPASPGVLCGQGA